MLHVITTNKVKDRILSSNYQPDYIIKALLEQINKWKAVIFTAFFSRIWEVFHRTATILWPLWELDCYARTDRPAAQQLSTTTI